MTINRSASWFRGILTLSLLWAVPQWSSACTREDAFNRMMALNQYGMKLQAALPDPLKDPHGYDANYKRVIAFNTRLSAAGKTLADAKYDEACATYDALAKEYEVNLAAQGVQPLSALEAASRKPPQAGCDLAESARRSAWLVESFKQHADAEQLGREAWRVFGKETEPVGLLMQQDPNSACRLIEIIAAKYGLQR